MDADPIVIDRGSAGDPGGKLTVWLAADATLLARTLGGGEEPADGRWRGREHDCPEAPR